MTYPFGIDVSSYQKRMDWQRAISTGATFAFVKATEGADWADPTFAYNWRELRRLGIPHGAYHYFRPKEDALLQAQEFVDIVDPEAGELMVLDVENSGGLDRVMLTRCVIVALETIYAMTGRYPLIYSRASWLNANVDVSALPKLDYWLAQYRNAAPYPLFTSEYPSDKLTLPRGVSKEQIKFHQSGEKGNGKKYGAQSHYVDLDRFLGNDLTAYFGGTSETQPEPIPPSETQPLYQARVSTWATPHVNLRSEPRIAKETDIGDAFPGQVLDVLEEREVSGVLWLRTNKGWLMAQYIERLTASISGLLEVPFYSQRDPRWGNDKMGHSSILMKNEGCLVSITAAGMTYFGHHETPGTLNRKLTDNGGYASPNLFYWNMPAILYGDILKTEDRSFVNGAGFEIDVSRILSEKRPVWAVVDFVPGGTFNQHWVLIIGKVEGVFYLLDPWDGTVQALGAKYKKIFRIVGYKKS